MTTMILISSLFFLEGDGGGGGDGDIGKQCRALRLISFFTVCLQSVLFKFGERDEK